MRNLDSVTKSKDVPLPTNGHIVRAMVFLVVMYGCESQIINKAERQKNWCLPVVVLEKILESPLDSKETKPVNPKWNQPWILIGKLKLKLQYFGHLMWTVFSLEKALMLGKIEGRRRRGHQRMRCLDGITGQTLGDNEGQGAWRAAVHGIANSWTWLGDWTKYYRHVTL